MQPRKSSMHTCVYVIAMTESVRESGVMPIVDALISLIVASVLTRAVGSTRGIGWPQCERLWSPPNELPIPLNLHRHGMAQGNSVDVGSHY